MDEHVMGTYIRSEFVLQRGSGSVLVDEQGKQYLDFLGGIAVNALGYGHAELNRVLKEQIDSVVHVSNLYRHPFAEELADKLTAVTGMESVFFSNSGAEAMECALKLARKHHYQAQSGNSSNFVALEGSFHGRTMGALSVTHKESYRRAFEPLGSQTEFVPRNDLNALRAAVEETKPAAVVLEPIQGESGVYELDRAFLQLARELCDRHGSLLIHDEVQCGCGRSGSFLAADWSGVKPDLVTLAKPLAAGLPMGATLANARYSGVLVPGDHGSTFGGGPLASRAALFFLNAWKHSLQQNVTARGEQLSAGLKNLVAEIPIATASRGRGLMQALELDSPERAAAAGRELHALGLLTCPTGSALRFLPPYIIEEHQIEQGLELLRSALHAIQD